VLAGRFCGALHPISSILQKRVRTSASSTEISPLSLHGCLSRAATTAAQCPFDKNSMRPCESTKKKAIKCEGSRRPLSADKLSARELARLQCRLSQRHRTPRRLPYSQLLLPQQFRSCAAAVKACGNDRTHRPQSGPGERPVQARARQHGFGTGCTREVARRQAGEATPSAAVRWHWPHIP
jgi:hypothetical protein